MTLTEFLLARIAEDEVVAREMLAAKAEVADLPPVPAYVPIDDEDLADYELGTFAHVLRWTPARVLAECAAKRRIVELFSWVDEVRTNDPTDTHEDRWYDGDDTLLALAQPFADHEDFDPAWEPT